MAIAAQRFKFLDNETNLPTADFSGLTDNAVYNNLSSIIESGIASAQNSNGIIDKVNDSISELNNIITSASTEVMNKIKDALNSAMDAISKMELPSIVKDIFNSLKNLDLGGVKDFLKDLLHVGSAFLCNNLDFLKAFMLGYALNKNIISGLLIALLLSWLDRYCKGFTKEEMKISNPLSNLEKVIPPQIGQITSGNIFKTFTENYSSYLKANTPIEVSTPLSQSAFLTNVLSGDIKSSLDNLRNSEISSTDKKGYLDFMTISLNNYQPSTTEYKNILQASGELKNLPLINIERRNRSINYSNLSDKLGNFVKGIQKTELKDINSFNLSALEKGLFDKIKDFKNLSNNTDTLTRSNNSGSFKNYDFSKVMPAISPEETTYLNNLQYEDTSHRTHDIHPTSEIFMV